MNTITSAASFACLNFQPRNVRRTKTSIEVNTSLFVQDPSTVIPQKRRGPSLQVAMYLNTFALEAHMETHQEALFICDYMEMLRHPKLVQLAVVVTDSAHRNRMVESQHYHGTLIPEYISELSTTSKKSHSIASLEVMQIASQTALTHQYLQQTTRSGHHALCPHSILYDLARGETIVLLTIVCAKCRSSTISLSRKADVINLIRFVPELLEEVSCNKAVFRAQTTALEPVVNGLQSTVGVRNRTQKSMSDLCKLFSSVLDNMKKADALAIQYTNIYILRRIVLYCTLAGYHENWLC